MFAFADAPGFWLQLGQIVLLDVLLAGDNALVIALAVRTLPEREQRLGRLWGTFGAVALRVSFLAIAAWLLQVPLLRLAGGLVLLWIAWKLLVPKPAHEHPADEHGGVRSGSTLGAAIRVIIVADVSMSIDNVFAVTGAAHGQLALAIAGVALSIPMVVWGSAVLSRIMAHHRWVVWLGGGVLGHVAGVLVLEDAQIAAWFGEVEAPGWHWLPIALGVAFTALGVWGSRRARA